MVILQVDYSATSGYLRLFSTNCGKYRNKPIYVEEDMFSAYYHSKYLHHLAGLDVSEGGLAYFYALDSQGNRISRSFLHRKLCPFEKGSRVLFLDGDSTNLVRDNLRVVPTLGFANLPKANLRGVFWDIKDKKWRAQYLQESEVIIGRAYEDPEDAYAEHLAKGECPGAVHSYF